ncbi:MAG: hypothetical protein M1815_004303 [Lichina confinis]|nr:MAG: hypothetical protein M1815_004303 [Lichina confinis]
MDFSDDEDYWWDIPIEEPDWADDLTEHVIPSPNWQAHEWDHDQDLEEYFSDWNYYSDGYYDRDQTGNVKQHGRGEANKNPAAGEKATPAVRKPRHKKTKPKTALASRPQPAWASPPVVYRRERRPPSPPTYVPGSTEKVSLLKDWRERYGKDQGLISRDRIWDGQNDDPSKEGHEMQPSQVEAHTRKQGSISREDTSFVRGQWYRHPKERLQQYAKP